MADVAYQVAYMAKRVLNKLSPLAVARLKEPGRHSDGGGLYLSIDKSGRKRWVFLYTRHGRRVELGLGGGRDLPLAGARSEAATLRQALERGEDPRALKAAATEIPTFGAWADEYIERMRPSWRNPKHAAQWVMTLTSYARPLRDRQIDSITTDDVLAVLTPHWRRVPETAERLRGRIENVLDAAKAKGYRTGENPARWRGHLDQLLPKRQRLTRGHHAALPFVEIPAFMATLRGVAGMAALALEFLILTVVRSRNVLEATWSEIDLEASLWIIPPERMKTGQEHRVPLGKRALEILEHVRPLTGGAPGAFVFPGARKGRPLSGMSMAMMLRRLRPDITVHGFRSTFRDWAAETTDHAHETCEMALAHVISNKAEKAYRRGDLIEKRRALMEEWDGYCAG